MPEIKRSQILLVILFLVFNLTNLHTISAQKTANKLQITVVDKNRIENKIRDVLEDYRRMLNFLSDSNPVDEKTEWIDVNLTNIFYSLASLIQDDINGSSTMMAADEYLLEIKNLKKLKGKEVKFIFDNNVDLEFYKSKETKVLIAIVKYEHIWNLTDETGKKKFPSSYKVVVFRINNDEDSKIWNAQIINLYNENDFKKEFNLSVYTQIRVSEEQLLNESEEEEHESYYYQGRLIQGKAYIKSKQYAKAYFCLNEAKQKTGSPQQLSDVKEFIKDLVKTIRKIKGDDEKWEHNVFNSLVAEADKLVDLSEYELASAYYALAASTDPASALDDKKFGIKVDKNKEKVRIIRVVNNLFLQEKYDEVIKQCDYELSLDPVNSVLIAEKARSYGMKKGQDDQAKKYFSQAITSDQRNATIYKWQAEYYFLKKEYQLVINACIKYISIAEENDPEINKMNSFRTLSNAFLLKGINPTAASDYCDSAISYYSNNADAYLLKSQLLFDSKSDLQAYKNSTDCADSAISVAKKMKNQKLISKAYAKKADLISIGKDRQTNADKKEKDELNAIELYEQAVEIDKKNLTAYFNLGGFYLEKAKEEMNKKDGEENKKSYLTKAMNCFKVVSKDSNADNNSIKNSKWKLGVCYLLNNSFNEASKELESISSSMIGKNQFTIDFALSLILSGKDIDRANSYLNKCDANRAEVRYSKLLYQLKTDANNFNPYKKSDELTSLFNTLPPFYTRQKIENDLRTIGREELINGSLLKRALNDKIGN